MASPNSLPCSIHSLCSLVSSTGAGYGTYTSVDFALLMDVLKNKQDHAKDIAVWHQV